MDPRHRRRCRCLNGRLCVCDVMPPMPIGAPEIFIATMAVVGWLVALVLAWERWP